jgi:hypothetical protein
VVLRECVVLAPGLPGARFLNFFEIGILKFQKNGEKICMYIIMNSTRAQKINAKYCVFWSV